MVYKAAGKINDVWSQSSPYGIARTFIIALNLKEFEILKQTYKETTQEELQYYLKDSRQLRLTLIMSTIRRTNEIAFL